MDYKNRIIKISFGLILALGLTNFSFPQDLTKKFNWPENKKAAVCLTFDDGLDCHLDKVIPLLDSFNIKATFFCTGNSASIHNRIPEWRKIVENGHELGNHSLFHPCDGRIYDWVKPEYDLSKYSREQLKTELYTANTLLNAIDGKTERTFSYTCSEYKTEGDTSFVDIVKQLFFAARAGGGIIPSTMSNIDIHFMPSWSVNNNTGNELINYVEKAKADGTIAIFMFHSVGGGYLNTSIEALNELLNYLNDNENDYWVDNFYNVTKYISTELEKIR